MNQTSARTKIPEPFKRLPWARMPTLACHGGLPYIRATGAWACRRGDSALGRDSTIGRRCERAVVTAYRELRVHGNADYDAFRACTTLYRIHHPEASMNEARRLVAEWIDHHVVQAKSGPTSGCDCN